MLPDHQLRSEPCMVVDDHISDKVTKVCVQQGRYSNFKLALMRQTMVDLAQRPAGTERTQQNSLSSLEFSEVGPGYHFTSRCCSCPLTAALPSAHHQTCYQSYAACPSGQRVFAQQQQPCPGAEFSACRDGGSRLKPLSQREVIAINSSLEG